MHEECEIPALFIAIDSLRGFQQVLATLCADNLIHLNLKVKVEKSAQHQILPE